MRLLVVSDTHGNRAGILQALAEAGKIDMLLHCGDGASDACVAQSLIDGGAYAVRGNCDFAAGDPYQRVLAVEDKKILILHGHRQRVKETLFDLYDLGRAEKVDLVCFGHTHHPLLERNGNLMLLNPGSLRGYDASYAVVDIRGDIHSEIYRLRY